MPEDDLFAGITGRLRHWLHVVRARRRAGARGSPTRRPKPEDVKAGWGAFALFLLLIAAVALLGFSLTKHLRKAQAAEEAGVFGAEAPAPTDWHD